MHKVFSNNEIEIFSNKQLSSRQDEYLFFEDGSKVDLRDLIILNRGGGEIRIEYKPSKPDYENLISREIEVKKIEKVFLSGGMLNVYILPSINGNTSLDIIGTSKFYDGINIDTTSGELLIETADNSSNIVIGDVWVNGKRKKQEPDEAYGEIHIKANSLDFLDINSRGKGHIRTELPLSQLKLKISGSMSIFVNEVEKIESRISGSGSINIRNLKEDAVINISGSGEVNIDNGDIDKIDLNLSGSGEINANIAVNEAILQLSGSGRITVNHVKEQSIERCSGSGKISVNKRGNI